MNCRAFVFAGFALPLTAGVADATAGDVEVIYIGGKDCPYCAMWQDQYKAEWLASPEFKQVTWIEVDVPHLREAYDERYWTGELRTVLDQIPDKNGTPRFLIVSKGKIVFNAAGANQWERTMRALKNVLG